MFKVKDNRTGAIKTAYDVSGIMLLFFDGLEWYWDYMEYYRPMEG